MRELAVTFVVFIAVILGGVQHTPATLPAAHDLTGRRVLNTGPFACDSEWHRAEWTNDSGTRVHIRRAHVWMGMYRGGVSDFAFWLTRDSDDNLLGTTNWDHYSDPTLPHIVRYTYAPDYITVPAGDSLALKARCTNIDEQPNLKGHVTVTVWYY